RRRGQHRLDHLALGRAEVALARTAGVARLGRGGDRAVTGVEVGIGVLAAASAGGEQRDDGEGEQAAFHRGAPVRRLPEGVLLSLEAGSANGPFPSLTQVKRSCCWRPVCPRSPAKRSRAHSALLDL